MPSFKHILTCCLFLIFFFKFGLAQKTIFEKSNGKQTATYFEVIDFYKNLAKRSSLLKIQTMGQTDAGYPLHLILVNGEKDFNPISWHEKNKLVIMINNGIHPGEPDGIDASMMIVRDIIDKKIKLPANVALGIIPVYNIGGALNRNSTTRVNQDGPESYGFRGNGQNLDLNRDFTKSDSKNARSFAEIFHFLNPDILLDTHVSDGADYQHSISLITTQYDKLGPSLGNWVKTVFDPALFKGMKEKNWNMAPYINVEGRDPSVGFPQFYDSPRYSSGYAALFNTVSYMPETHMLKPYKERVSSTYDLLKTYIEIGSQFASELIAHRQKAIQATVSQQQFPLSWIPDTTRYSTFTFMGYSADTKISGVTGLPVLHFDHSKPFSKTTRYYDTYLPENIVGKPEYFVIPQGWWAVGDLLKLNGVKMQRLQKDTIINVEVATILDYKSSPVAYEKHHKNSKTKIKSETKPIQFLKGDYLIPMNQKANRYIMEMLDPTGDDSFFAWNFFDAIFQQKEWYSDYRWNDIAEEYLKTNPDLKLQLEKKKEADPQFAQNSSAQLRFIYLNSPWYEPAHMRYPVYKINKK